MVPSKMLRPDVIQDEYDNNASIQRYTKLLSVVLLLGGTVFAYMVRGEDSAFSKTNTL